jgi:RND superfamily putative drug exporter
MPFMPIPAPTGEQQSAPSSTHARLHVRGIYRVALAYGRFVHRFRWLILVAWLVVVAVSVLFMIQTVDLLGSGDTLSNGSESAQVAHLLKTRFHRTGSQVLVVLHAPSTPVSAPAYQQEIQSLAGGLRARPEIRDVTIAPPGADGKTVLLVVETRPGVAVPVADLRLLLAAARGPARTSLTGGPAIDDEITHTSLGEVERTDLLALPIALLILIIVFGTGVAACMPIVLVLVTVPLAFALLYPLALHAPISTYVLSVASIVGLGIAIDYSLLLIRRFREELARGHNVPVAIGWTLATAGEALLFSGLIVMVGFSGLLLIGSSIPTSIGIGGTLIVFSAVLGALTFLPALLCILGSHVNALRVPYLWRLTMAAHLPQAGEVETHGKQERFWRALALRVMQHPLLTVALACVLLIALSWPVFSLRIGATGVNSLPTSSQARQGLLVLQAQYPSLRTQSIELIVETTDHSTILSFKNLQRLAVLTNWLRSQAHVRGVSDLLALPVGSPPSAPGPQQLIALYTSGAYQQDAGLAQFVAQNTAGDLTSVTLSSDAALDSAIGNAQIDFLRAHSSGVVPGLRVLVGGDQASDLDFGRGLFDRFPLTILFLLLATLVLLIVMFRSLLIPLKAVVMNVVSISAAYGVLVFVFQWGHFSTLLGFTSSGYVDDLIPIVLFCVLFGLSMDYEVFLLSRVREEWLRTQNNRLAIVCGLERTGSVITNAALLFLVVTIAFIFTSQLDIKEMGLGMTVSILTDATIIRSLLVPATMRLLGRWNWWMPGAPLPPRQGREDRDGPSIVAEGEGLVRTQQATNRHTSRSLPGGRAEG